MRIRHDHWTKLGMLAARSWLFPRHQRLLRISMPGDSGMAPLWWPRRRGIIPTLGLRPRSRPTLPAPVTKHLIPEMNAMLNVHTEYQGEDHDFESASLLGKNVAKENQMLDPTIMAWHKGSGQHMPALYDGADPETSRAKCGAGNGGKLEVNVGNDHQFIMVDTSGHEKLGEMPLRKLSDGQGDDYLCLTPLVGKKANSPTQEACTHLEDGRQTSSEHSGPASVQ